MQKERFTFFIKASDDGRSSVKEIVHCKDCTTGSLKISVISGVSKKSKQYWLPGIQEDQCKHTKHKPKHHWFKNFFS